jgi:hypothetical protein
MGSLMESSNGEVRSFFLCLVKSVGKDKWGIHLKVVGIDNQRRPVGLNYAQVISWRSGAS